MLENAIFITEESNDKRINDFESYRYYVVGVNMAGVEYTAKLVIGVKNGETYYDHSLTEIEKTNLIDRRDEISSSFTANEDAIFEYKDKRLISILHTNSSKVVDANGEPLVVYHYSNSPKISAFNPFRRANELTEEETEKIGKIRDAHSSGRSSLVKPFMGIWATPIRGEYADYGKYEYALFANIRNPRITDRVSPNLSGDKKSDGVFSYANGILTEVSSILPERFKSATDNAGTFDVGNPDIRYSSVSEDAYQRAIAAQAETLSSSEVEEYAKSLANIAPEGVRVVITNSSQAERQRSAVIRKFQRSAVSGQLYKNDRLPTI